MYKLTSSGFMVLPDYRLPGGWNISAGNYPILPLPCGKELSQLIEEHRRALSMEDRADPSYRSWSDLW
jgi:hypothetical protein